MKYRPVNNILRTIKYASYGQGEGIAIDQQGNIYIAFGPNTINIYDPSGKLINALH